MTSEQIKKKKIFIFRDLMPEIKQMMIDGCRLSDIHVLCQGKGLDINFSTFKSYLNRENVSLKKLLHAKVLSADSVNKPQQQGAVTARQTSGVAVISESNKLPEITSRTDFKKLNETSDIDLEPSAAMREEANRILGE